MKVDDIRQAEKTKACLNLELIVRKEISSEKGLHLTNTLCPNCADKNNTVVQKLREVTESFECQGGPLNLRKEQQHL